MSDLAEGQRGSGDVAGLTSELSKQVAIFDGDVFAFYRQHAAFLETPQQTADGFDGQTKIVADITAGHRQAEFARRETALRETTGQIINKGRQTLFRILLDSSRIMSGRL